MQHCSFEPMYPMYQAERATCSTISMLPLSSEGPASPRLLSEGCCLDDCVPEVALACTRNATTWMSQQQRALSLA